MKVSIESLDMDAILGGFVARQSTRKQQLLIMMLFAYRPFLYLTDLLVTALPEHVTNAHYAGNCCELPHENLWFSGHSLAA